jgi:hypothetical protein
VDDLATSRRLLDISLGCAVIFAVAACVSYIDFDKRLNSIVGRRVSDVTSPGLSIFKRLESSDKETETIEYSVDPLWRCNWILEIDRGTKKIVRWRYSNAEAARWCASLPATRP